MTTASEAGGFRYQTLANRIAHGQPLLWFAAAGLAAWNMVMDSDIPQWVVTSLTGAVFVSIFAEVKHMRSLCEICAANTPLDTDAAVVRYGRWLRGAHWQAEHVRLAALTFLGLIVVQFCPWKFLWAPATITIDVLLGLQIYCGLKHRVLQPWCPQCRWDGGGDEEFSPEPAPPPGIRADR